jgi:TonB family protein
MTVQPLSERLLPGTAFAIAGAMPGARPGWPLESLLVAVWLAGLLVTMTHLIRQQVRFQRAMGRVRHYRDGCWRADGRVGLPAVLGLLRPRIVLPEDFEQRYTTEQQQLVLRHERIHIARGDAWLNAMAAALRSVYWFNPLLHLAIARFRDDQEFSCDAQVLAARPAARRSYGEAMLNTQLAEARLPVGCHWFGTGGAGHHPLKARIAMLSNPQPSKHRRRLAATALALMAVALSWLAWAAQPPALVAGGSGEGIRVEYSAMVARDGQPIAIHAIQTSSAAVDIPADPSADAQPALRLVSGDSFALQVDAGDSRWQAEIRVDGAADVGYRLRGEIARNGREVQQVGLSAQAGQTFVLQATDPDSGESLSLESTLSRADAMPIRAASVSLRSLGVLELQERARLGARGQVLERQRRILRVAEGVDADALMRDPRVAALIDEALAFSDLQWFARIQQEPTLAADPLAWHSLTLDLDPGPLDRTLPGGGVKLVGANPDSRTIQLTDAPVPGDSERPSYRSIVSPKYSADAVGRGEQGAVHLLVRVSEDGAVADASITRSSGYPALDAAALDAVAKWTFYPARRNGRPQASEVTVPIMFETTPGSGQDAPVPAGSDALDQIYVRSL